MGRKLRAGTAETEALTGGDRAAPGISWPHADTITLSTLGGWGAASPPGPADPRLSSPPGRPFTASIYQQKSSQLHKRS